jgi:hypothetical protein
MSKEELYEILKVHAPFRPMTSQHAVNAMVAAYNQAIEDAKQAVRIDYSCCDSLEGSVFIDQDSLEQLKIIKD